MRFSHVSIIGACIVDCEPVEDERGLFARTFCREEFSAHGLDARVSQCNVSVNSKAGTLRGMHLQAAPHGEAKLVRCTRGRIYDVAVDLRPESDTYLRWAAVELSAADHRAFYIPVGCAHGFQTLEPDCEVLYQMSVPYVPGAGRGVRFDDPAFGIAWPDPPTGGRTISERDAAYPNHAP